nr:uncharacterized protein LOC108122566 [Drosophila bipectinata]
MGQPAGKYKKHFQEGLVFKFTNVVCKSHNQSWFVFHYCRLKAVSRERVVLNINATALHPAYDITFKVIIFKKANGYKPWILQGTIDGCRYMRKPYNPVIRIVFDLFKEFSNINHTCPFVGPQVVKDFYLRPEVLRLPFPSGDYMMSGQWYFDKKPQFDTNVSFMYTEDLLKRS